MILPGVGEGEKKRQDQDEPPALSRRGEYEAERVPRVEWSGVGGGGWSGEVVESSAARECQRRHISCTPPLPVGHSKDISPALATPE